MKSFRSSFINLSNVGMSSTSITPASLLADQCVKAFDQIPPLLQDIRSVSIPEGIITLEAGLERAVESGIGNTLAEIIKQYVENISAKQSEALQSALSAATTHINTCSEVAKKAQKKKKWDKDLGKRLEDNWFLFCLQMIKISKLLPLAQTKLRSIQELCDNALVRPFSNTPCRTQTNFWEGCGFSD
ncbi:hypothetical protein OEA41_008338 [Lepraria neglecta]|uniref:Uncharacterized protein n=1 Tax=Lepraria neglecta TaxID=209136 RepID=A0AAE0DP18_9LECA|nr:hypothetical protein OEA41_008338 [Lepraria neglecta]